MNTLISGSEAPGAGRSGVGVVVGEDEGVGSGGEGSGEREEGLLKVILSTK